jgi:hypothetical protein
MTVHAEEEMSDDGLTIFDVERAILTGEIIERQQDHQSSEWKYLITGRAVSNKLTGLWRKGVKVMNLNLKNPVSFDLLGQGKHLNQAKADSGVPSIEASNKKD